MAGLNREVVRWIQSLDLTWQVKVPKWDFTNGYLIAEIFSWYHPNSIQMHNYNKGQSLDSKQKNWDLIINFVKKAKLEIPMELLEGTLHTKDGAAAALIERMYEILTNRQIRKVEEGMQSFTDNAYQAKLPMHSRSTAIASIKNNLKMTELMANTNQITNQQKAQEIIMMHIENRRLERLQDPKRFNKKKTLGERCPRTLPMQTYENLGNTADSEPRFTPEVEQQVQFKEVSVKQMRTPPNRPSAQGVTP